MQPDLDKYLTYLDPYDDLSLAEKKECLQAVWTLLENIFDRFMEQDATHRALRDQEISGQDSVKRLGFNE